MSSSVADLKKNYSNLNVDFDLWKGESDAEPYIDHMVQMLIDKGLAYESQGALVVDVAQEGDTKEIPPCLIRKSDGASLYATSDLATIVEREQDFKPDRYIYVVDKRQAMHFEQVFRVSRKAEIVKPDTKMIFLGFGTMNGKDGKPFKTREGGVMRLENLIREINEEMYKKIMDNRTVSEEEAKKTAQMVGLAAIKYGDLSNQASKDYVFDVDRFTSFEGNTGPYILYTIVRIKSILNKYQEENSLEDLVIREASSEFEKALMLECAKFNDVIETVYEETAPHKLCAYIYDLANVGKAGGLLAIVELFRDQLVTLIILISVPLHNRSVQGFLHISTVTHKVILERIDAGAIIVLGLRSGQELSGCIIGKCPVGLHDLISLRGSATVNRMVFCVLLTLPKSIRLYNTKAKMLPSAYSNVLFLYGWRVNY